MEMSSSRYRLPSLLSYGIPVACMADGSATSSTFRRIRLFLECLPLHVPAVLRSVYGSQQLRRENECLGGQHLESIKCWHICRHFFIRNADHLKDV